MWNLQLYYQSKFRPSYFLSQEEKAELVSKQAFEDPDETQLRNEATLGSEAIRYKQYFYKITALLTETMKTNVQ